LIVKSSNELLIYFIDFDNGFKKNNDRLTDSVGIPFIS